MIAVILQSERRIKMNYEKTIKIINELLKTIKERMEDQEYESSRIYVSTWVYGHLNQIKERIENRNLHYAISYKELFVDFIHYYFCLNINPSIKMVTIACLYTNKIRDLIIDLYNHIFNVDERVNDAQSCGYVYEFAKDHNESMFEIIRIAYCRKGRC